MRDSVIFRLSTNHFDCKTYTILQRTIAKGTKVPGILRLNLIHNLNKNMNISQHQYQNQHQHRREQC